MRPSRGLLTAFSSAYERAAVKVDAHVVYHHRWKVATGAVPSASISPTGSTRLGGIRQEGRDPIHVFRRFGRRTGASDCIRRVRGQKFISRLHEEVLDISHVKIFIVALALRRFRGASVPRDRRALGAAACATAESPRHSIKRKFTRVRTFGIASWRREYARNG